MNIIISYIFLKNLIDFFYFNYIFSSFFGFTFTCYIKTINVSIYKIISAVFVLGIILDRLLKGCVRYILPVCILSLNKSTW